MVVTSRTDQQKRHYRPADLIGGSRRAAIPAVGVLAVLALGYLLLSRHDLSAAIGFVVVLPLLVLGRPGLAAMLLTPVIPILLITQAYTYITLRATGGALAAVLLGMIAHVIVGSVRLRREHFVIALLAAVLGLSLLFPAVHLHSTVSPTADLIGLLEGLVLLSAALAAPPSLDRLGQVVALTGAVEGAYALVHGLHSDGRLVTESLNPNYLGAALAVPVVAAIGLAWSARRPWWLLAALPSLAALVATRSRGAMLSVVAGVIVLAVVRLRRARWPVLVAAAAVAALLATGGATWVQRFALGGRSSNELNRNNEIHADAAKFAIQVALHNPVRGIGYGMFAPYAGLHSPQHIVINTHDDFLRLAVEAGVAALLLFLYLLWRGVSTLRSSEHMILGAAVVTYAVGLVFANTLSNLIVTVPFWVALGAVAGHAGRDAEVPGRHRPKAGAPPAD